MSKCTITSWLEIILNGIGEEVVLPITGKFETTQTREGVRCTLTVTYSTKAGE